VEVSWDKEITQISLDNSALFFHTVSKPVQIVVIKYDDIFQALSVQGDVQLQKPFLNPGFGGAVRWKLPASEMFFSVCQHVEVQGGRVGAVWWGQEVAPGAGRPLSTARALKISSYVMTSTWTIWKICGKIEDWCPKISICPCLHLLPFT
jgi:hypothetical protein